MPILMASAYTATHCLANIPPPRVFLVRFTREKLYFLK
ncbi:hypothetical protein ACHAXM_007416 [Skeletonema potamos]